MDQLAHKDVYRSNQPYAPRANEIGRSDGVGLEQPLRTSNSPRLGGSMLTFGRGGVALKGQPSTKSSTSSSIPAKAEDLGLDPEHAENEEDDVPPWEKFRVPKHMQTAWKSTKNMVYNACLMQSQCSCPFVIAFLAVLGIIIGAGMVMLPVKIETSFDSFLKTDVQVSVIYDTWTVWRKLLADRNRNWPNTPRLLQDSAETIKDIILLYQLRKDDLPGGLANVKCLYQIAVFEQSLRDLPKWQEFCGLAEASNKELCDPGLSYAGYGLPTLVTDSGNFIPKSLVFDGRGLNRGWEPLPVKTALLLAAKHKVQSLFFDESFNIAVDESVTTVRSVFRFRARGENGKRLSNEWQNFCQDELIPLLNQGLDSDLAQMYYDGSGFEHWEVLRAMWQDVSWAAGAVLFVILYLLFHTRSIVLSMLGLLSALLSLPLSYLLCAVLAGTTTVSFASALIIFLIIGFGCDMVLVYTDFWRDSVHVKDKYVDRLAFTYKHGGSATLATASVTALSFFANLASVIRALRQLGFFMGLCVSVCWLLITVIYVPSCLMDERLARRCSRRRSGRGFPGRSLRERLLKQYGLHLQRWRWLYLIVPVLAVIVGLVVAAVKLDVEFEPPTLFSEDHPRQKGQQLMREFEAMSSSFGAGFVRPPLNEIVCSKDVAEAMLDTCTVVWCDASERLTQISDANGSLSCDCVRREKTCTAGNNETNVFSVRWVGLGSRDFDLEAASRSLMSMGQGTGEADVGSVGTGVVCKSDAAPGQLLMQDWASGFYDLEAMRQCEGSSARIGPGAVKLPTCGWEDRCYCSEFACRENSQWETLPRLDLSPLLSSSRRLLTQTQAAKVRMVFGLAMDSKVPMLGEVDPADRWSFNDGFNAAHPWAQRNLNSLCSDITPDLKVVKQWCWINKFRIWLVDRGERFPTRAAQFMPRLTEFLTEYSSSRYYDYIWLNDAQTEVKATFFSFMLGVPREPGSGVALDLKGAWDKFSGSFNGKASSHAKGGILVSSLWVDAQAQSELLSSSISTIVNLVILAFCGMLVFTMSFVLSFFVVLVTLWVIAALMFFLVVIVDWKTGLVEGVALIYFIGYAVTYALHISHKYGTGGEVTRSFVIHDEDLKNERLTRTIHALTSIGGAALGSAATTAGASFFLIFCTLVIFRRLGTMCLVVTVCSIVAAFGPLPAGLLICGPSRPGRGCGKTMACLWRISGPCRKRCARCIRAGCKSHPEEDLPPWSPSRRKNVDPQSPARGPGDASPARRGDLSPARKLSLGDSTPTRLNSPRRMGSDSPRRGGESPMRQNSLGSPVTRSPSRSSHSQQSGGESPQRGPSFENLLRFDQIKHPRNPNELEL